MWWLEEVGKLEAEEPDTRTMKSYIAKERVAGSLQDVGVGIREPGILVAARTADSSEPTSRFGET